MAKKTEYYFKKGTTVYKVKPEWTATISVCEKLFSQPELEDFVDEDTMGDVVKEMSSVMRGWAMFDKNIHEHSIAFTSNGVLKLLGMEKFKSEYFEKKAEAERRNQLGKSILQCPSHSGMIELFSNEEAYKMRVEDYSVTPRRTLVFHGDIQDVTEDSLGKVMEIKGHKTYQDYTKGTMDKNTALESFESLVAAAMAQQTQEYKWVLVAEND